MQRLTSAYHGPLCGVARPLRSSRSVSESPVEFRALVAAFNRLSERIAQLLKARMALIGGISHDLRTYATRLTPLRDRRWSYGVRPRGSDT